MRKLTILLSFLFPPLFLSAQLFSEAPKDKRPIREIVEWTTFVEDEDDPEETIRDAVYTFRKDGQLKTWTTNNSYDEIYHYEYDPQNRLNKITIENKDSARLMTYQYYENRRMAEIQERLFDVRTIQYFNNKQQVIEEKTFVKGDITGGQWTTMSRVVYNYDDRDSLFGEMVYDYEGFDRPVNYKILHRYDPASGKRSKTIRYDETGKPWKETSYRYDSSGRLTGSETKVQETGFEQKTTHLYKDGALWQSITAAKDYKTEKIYSKGRLIRLKEYDKEGQLLWYTDYQYLFF